MQAVGRLAPSPTGLLHLGNAWAFFAAWFLCRHEHGRLLLRLEDIDPERSRKEYADRLVDDLRWLGLHWDYGYATENVPVSALPSKDALGKISPSKISPSKISPSKILQGRILQGKGLPDKNLLGKASHEYMQSNRLAIYAEELVHLKAQGRVYPCFCSREQIRSIAGAPHIGDCGAPYSGTCRNLTPEMLAHNMQTGRKPAMRFRIPDDSAAIFHFIDRVYGLQSMNLADCGGDFAVQRSDGVFAYQWAVSIDDAIMGVTQVVRGRDILPSTPRQLALLQCLGATPPEYIHIPLLCDAEGMRLAKRHASLTLANMREAGCTAPEVLGYIAHTMRLIDVYKPMKAESLLAELNPQHLLAQARMGDVCVDIDPITSILGHRT